MQTPPKVNQKPGFSVQDPTGTHGRFDKETARVWLRHLARAFKSEGREIDWRGHDRFMVITRRPGVTEAVCCRVVERKSPSPLTGEGRGGGERAA